MLSLLSLTPSEPCTLMSGAPSHELRIETSIADGMPYKQTLQLIDAKRDKMQVSSLNIPNQKQPSSFCQAIDAIVNSSKAVVRSYKSRLRPI